MAENKPETEKDRILKDLNQKYRDKGFTFEWDVTSNYRNILLISSKTKTVGIVLTDDEISTIDSENELIKKILQIINGTSHPGHGIKEL